MDKPAVLRLLFCSSMAQSENKFVTPVSILVNVILVAGFFIYMFGVLKPHVPSSDPQMITLWAALTSACMSGTFWIAIQMFRVVYRAQRAAKK